MALVFLLALQSAAAAAPEVAAVDFDLARLPPPEQGAAGGARGCGPAGGAEILVCGVRRRGGDYPLEEMAREFAPRPIRAEMSIGGGAIASVYGQSVTVDRGAVSHRVLLGVRLPF